MNSPRPPSSKFRSLLFEYPASLIIGPLLILAAVFCAAKACTGGLETDTPRDLIACALVAFAIGVSILGIAIGGHHLDWKQREKLLSTPDLTRKSPPAKRGGLPPVNVIPARAAPEGPYGRN